MAFDFTLTDRVRDWQGRIRDFVDRVVIPCEQRAFTEGLTDGLRLELQAQARSAGIWAPQAKARLGGGGFRFDEAAVLLEEAGRSLLGPLAINAAAPDEGNIHLLAEVATPAQQERFLRPLAAGEVRSCFAMTEPPPGAGSDPAALRTTATRVGRRWLIRGDKHLITGADGAAFAIVMAANADGSGASMFLLDMATPGVHLEGHADTIDRTMVGGHGRLRFEDVEVAEDAVLGEAGQGLRYAQVRLAPARMTHCMRWLGAARRAHEIALDRSVQRTLFGAPLTEHGMAQQLIADNEIELAAARALLWQTCWSIAESDRGTESSSRAKVFISEVVGRVVDRSVQLCGGMGTSQELVVGRIYADVRAFRIYDGASEVHRMSIARRAARRAAAHGTGER